jgi:hypothetical protein
MGFDAIGVVVPTTDNLVPTAIVEATDIQSPYPKLAHVAERHRRAAGLLGLGYGLAFARSRAACHGEI